MKIWCFLFDTFFTKIKNLVFTNTNKNSNIVVGSETKW